MSKKRITFMAASAAILLAAGCSDSAKGPGSLIPDTPSNAPDYMCTWNIQGFVHDQDGPVRFREAMTEDYIFGDGKYENWISFFPSIREDLYFVMDDSWDIPADVNNGDNDYLGTVELVQVLPMPSPTCSRAGCSSDQKLAATITPDAKPSIAPFVFSLMPPRIISTMAAPSAVPKKGIVSPIIVSMVFKV